MGHRLSKIYTRTGDAGTTGLADGSRVAKTAPRVAAMGAVDELNALLGVLLTHPLPAPLTTRLTTLQHLLFDLGGELSLPGAVLVTAADVAWLERGIDALNDGLPPLKEFVLPGGSRPAAFAHLARTVCRRAEIELLRLSESGEPSGADARRFLNRLSDFLFVLARELNRSAGVAEPAWRRNARDLPGTDAG